MFSLKTFDPIVEENQQSKTKEVQEKHEIFKGYTMPTKFRLMQKEIEDFQVFDDDIWITTFPKCGTTWCQEMVWTISHDLDFESTKEETDTRMRFVEFSCMYDLSNDKNFNNEIPEYLFNSVKLAKNAKHPRILKTHLPFELLPKQIQTFEKKPKIIHVYRNVKDTCVSYYHFQRLCGGFKGDFDLFWRLFLNGKLNYTPMIDNILSYWHHREKANFLFIRFEDMKFDLHKVILDVCNFLNKSFEENEIQKLMNHLSFDAMKNNPYVSKHRLLKYNKSIGNCFDPEGQFIREGKTGGYKRNMSKSVENIFDEYIKIKLNGTRLILN